MPSLAVFAPHVRQPTEEYLSSVRSFLLSCDHLRSLPREIQTLQETWDILASHRSEIAALSEGPRFTRAFSDWIKTGESSTLREAKSGIVAMQSLVIIQVVQYFQYLELTGISHAECITALRKTGGIQGYCAGLLPALAIGCARSESEVVQNAKAALRVALAIGAYQQLGDDESIPGATSIILRLSTPGEGDEIVGQFPGCYVSAVTDPRTISVVGPVQALKELSEFARGRGLLTQDMHLRGKIHNPENLDLARELCEICDNTPSLQLPSFDKLQLPLRSNRTGGLIETCSLTHEAVYTILAARCEWYTLLERVAQDLKSTGENSHGVVCFGLGDCVPVSAFRLAGLSLTKTNVAQAIKQVELQKYEFNRDAIAVVGASCRLPGANSTDELWDLVSEAISMCEPVRPERMPPHWKSRIPENDDPSLRREYYGNFVDDIDKFDHQFFHIGAKEASYMDPQQRVLLELAYEALDSGGHLGRISRGSKNVGCFIGSGTQEYLENTSSHPPTAFTATGTIRAFLCGRLSHHFGWSGPAEVIDTACSSSLVAVHRACRAILGGECTMAIAGGVSFITGNVNHLDLGKAGFLSPTGQCKPFDASADGYCRADGAGLVVLKRLEDAKASGDHVLGVITATATNQGGGSTSITVPHAPAQTELLQTVLSLSGMTADHVTYVEAHGTGTSVGDPIEIASLRKVFGGPSRLTPLQVGTIKGNIGHCESAAGIAGLLKVLAMLKASKIPPLANFKELNPKISPLGPDKMTIAQSTEPWSAPIRVACVNSYGAAGSNAALLCCEYPSEHDRDFKLLEGDSRTSQPLPICISAHSRDSLMRYMDLLGRALGSQHVNLSNLAFSLNERREHHRFRFSTVAVDTATLHQELMRPKEMSEVPPKTPVVMAFGGQTKQFVGLERFLYDTCPRLRQYIDTCDEILVRLEFPSIIPAIFDTAPIADVRILQTATFVMQYACARCWIDSGLEVEAVIGHSFGELTALGVSGTWELTDCIRAIATRASLMVTEWGAERGSMLAVHTDRDTALGLTRRAQDCEIACYNAEMSQVVAGPTESIVQLERILVSESQYAQIRSQRLDVTHGFHSKLTEPLLSGLRTVAATIPVVTPEIRIETCTSAGCDKVAPDHIVRHTRDPVYFEDAVRRIEDQLGPCYWVEAGFNSSIIPMLKRAVRSPTLHKFQALDSHGSEPREYILPKITSDLWLDGMDVSFWPFLTVEESRPRHMTLPPYCFTRRGAWVENVGQIRVITGGISHQVEQPPKPVQLVSGPEMVGKQKVFIINTESKRFRDIVRGHAVLNSPLCPASMYMEFATMSAQLAGIDMAKGTLCFDDFHLEGPLGVDQGRRVTATLQPAKRPAVGWEFSVQSSRGTVESSSVTIHARGFLAIRLNRPHLEPYGRMIADQVNQLQSSANHEKLMATRSYRLFSQVVTYAEFLRGIKSVMISEGRALAEVQLPSGQVGTEESTAVGMCDAVSLDMFMQVSGLLINTGDHSESGSVFVATDIASATLSDDSSCFLQNTTWKVYATFVPAGKIHVTADVFVLWPDGSLALTVLGVRFTKLPISRLERLLQGNSAEMGARKKPNTAQKTDQMALRPQNPIVAEPRSIPTSATDKGIVFSPITASETEQKLKDIISSLTGAAIDRIDEDTLIVNLGVDSLAAVELVDDLANNFDIEVSATQLLTCSFKDLLNLLGRSKKGTLSPSGSRIVTSGSPLPAPHPGPFESSARPHEDAKRRKFEHIIAGACGADFPDLQGDDVTLCDLGVDSLAAIQLKSDLESAFGVVIRDNDISLDSSLGRITRALGVMGGCDAVDVNLLEHSTVASVVNDLPSLSSSSSGVLIDSRAGVEGLQINHARNAFEALLPSERELTFKGKRCGVATSWEEVTRRQNAIAIAYISEAFKQLGADLSELKPGTEIPSIPHLPRYSRALERYRIILQKYGYIESDGNTYRRTSLQSPRELACDLVISFRHDYPSYASEAELMSIAGPRLADCLAGRESVISLLFGGKRSRKALEDYYAHSPMLAASTELLVEVASRIVAESKGVMIRIIEVGGGFCGTTKRLAQLLHDRADKVEYTFTDISPSLVAQASKTMKEYKWMNFETYNLESSPEPHLRGKFDVVIGTNCVHATRDRVDALRNIRQLLSVQGCVLVSEVCETVDWYDIVFGLLDGWWLSTDGSYALQPVDCWRRCLRAAGFETIGHSRLAQRPLNIQRLFLASTEALNVSEKQKKLAHSSVETVVYKEIQGVKIPADIYIPRERPQATMSLVMMIHGGGHMTLSRKAIRPAQIDFLLQNGALSVSFDYRLCPEVNLIDGPIADIQDAYRWMQTELPTILERHSIAVDPTRIAVVGWSTGGHLAMTTAWTAKALGISPPRSILSFYGPIDFESGDLDKPRLYKDNKSRMSLEMAIKALSGTPITSYGDEKDEGGPADVAEACGWAIRPGDPRSELVMSLFRDGHGLSLLLNDIGSTINGGGDPSEWLQRRPTKERIASISPIARARAGDYATPTFIVHGTQDTVVPFSAAVDFVAALRNRDIKCGFLAIPGAGHLHDLSIVPGTAQWDAQIAPAYNFLLDSLQ